MVGAVQDIIAADNRNPNVITFLNMHESSRETRLRSGLTRETSTECEDSNKQRVGCWSRKKSKA